ncbi:MAG TPA: histidine phosphatase family protein [Polyangiales bacterium]|nr:histidine phosphatase family protein [Polyangiales bacterium]
MSIILVRHGETAGNAPRVLQSPDVPLNERGIRQARQLAERLRAFDIAHVLCSDFVRTRMTAEPIRAQLPDARYEESTLLRERDFGDLRGRPYAELEGDPFAPDFVPPNGESWPAFYERVAKAFALIAARRQGLTGDLLVVTHGLVCGVLLHRHLHMADFAAPPGFQNTSVTIFDPAPPHRVRTLNCTLHLSSEAAGRDGGAA